MAGNNGLSFIGLTYRTETTTFTTMSNGGPEQLFYFLLTPENGWFIFVLAVGIIFVNRVSWMLNCMNKLHINITSFSTPIYV